MLKLPKHSSFHDLFLNYTRQRNDNSAEETHVRSDNSMEDIVTLTIHVHVYDVRFDIKFGTQLTFVINSSTSVGIRFVNHII